MARTAEQRDYHAAKERQYRQKRRSEREEAIARLSDAVSVLRMHGYTPGQLVDLILAVLDR